MTERKRLSNPFVHRSSEAARQVLETIGDRAAYYAQFPRDQARVLRIIVGDLTRAVQQQVQMELASPQRKEFSLSV